MKNLGKKTIALLLALSFCLSSFAGVVAMAAEELKNSKPETLWHGCEPVEVKKGSGAYTFMSIGERGYEKSYHVMSDGQKTPIAELLAMVKADDDYTWTPNGKYSLGSSNYEVLYCCDADVYYLGNHYYKRLNLEDSDYYSPAQAAKIRAILTNAYPYVSMEQMKANLAAENFAYAADLTRSDLIAGIQAAIWACSNDKLFSYLTSHNVEGTSKWYGKVMHDYESEMPEEIQNLPKPDRYARYEDEEAGKRVDALIQHLLAQDAVYADKNAIVITDLKIIGANPVGDQNGDYMTTVRVQLNNGGSSDKDNIKLDIYVDGQLVKSKAVHREITSYDINIKAKAGQTIKAVVSGTQILPQGVYFYEPVGGRYESQCAVGIAAGETDVYAEAVLPIKSNTKIFVDKTAEPLNKLFQTDVTLKVPGEAFTQPVDVVFLLGGGMTANMETVKAAINVFKPIMEQPAAERPTVRLGLISLEKGKEIILDLNSEEAILHPDTYEKLIEDKFKYIDSLPAGTTNLHSQLVEAKKMLDADTAVKAENKYLFLVATGRTYWFDDANGEQATIVNKVNGTYYWGHYLWQSQRGGNTSLYMIPARYNNSYEAYLADIEKWVKADGNKYEFSPHFNVNDYSAYANWSSKNGKDLKALGLEGSRYGNGIVDPKPTVENFISGTMDAIGTDTDPKLQNALNYERAQYESIQVWKQLVAANYNCFSLCSESPNFLNGSVNIQSKGYTGSSTIQVGHAFMDYLAKLAGHKEATILWDYQYDENGKVIFMEGKEGNYNYAYTELIEDFFAPIASEILYTCGIGSYVEDYIGYDPEIGNFEFIVDAETIVLTVAGVEYITTQVLPYGDATATFEFTKPGATEPTFWLDYYYGNGTTTERFVWTFGEDATLANNLNLVYRLQLTDMASEDGIYWIDTNLSATLYPVVRKDVIGEFAPFVMKRAAVMTFDLRRDLPASTSVRPSGNYEFGDPVIFPVPAGEYRVASVDIEVTKVWKDGQNLGGKRPESITVKLLADGVDTGKTAVLSAATDWKAKFTANRFAGVEQVLYTVEEIAVDGYDSAVSGSAENGYVIVNTEKTHVTVRKEWNDAQDQDGIRPESITVKLLAGGVDTGKTVVLNAENQWTARFDDLVKFLDETLIVYTVEEIVPAGYEAEVRGNAAEGFVITNTHAPEVTEVSVRKEWNDAQDQDGIRPESITVKLLAGGVDTGKTVVLNAENQWTAKFANLDKFAAGAEIVYTVEEVVPAGYEAAVRGNAAEGFVITNTHVPETTEVSVRKEWADANNKDGIRPESITVKLLAGGVDTGKTVVLNAENQWTAKFANLDKFAAGAEIVYTVEEVVPAGYEAAVRGNAAEGFVITNTHVASTKVTLGGTKYMDGEVKGGYEFQILLPDGTVLETVVSGENGLFTFGELVFDRDGSFRYQIKEVIGTDELVLYDETVYTVIIDVVTEGEERKASVRYQMNGEDYQDAIEFYNETLTRIPDPDIPQTGDGFNRVWFMLMTVSGVLMLADIAVFGKKFLCKK